MTLDGVGGATYSIGMESTQADAQFPAAVRDLPRDMANSGPATFSRYGYQAKCIALHLLRHIGSDDLHGVLIEHSTDVILVPAVGLPELVSIKHREPNQAHTAAWTWTALKQSRVLSDLYEAWLAADKKATVAFWSNAGFEQKAYHLWEACSGYRPDAKREALAGLSRHLGISHSDAEEFMACLNLPRNTLPRRNEIDAIAVQAMAVVLESLGRSPAHAPACLAAFLHQYVEPASKDPDESRAFQASVVGATLRACLERRSEMELAQRYLAAGAVRAFLGRHADLLERQTPHSRYALGLEADPLFVGREEHLEQLTHLLRPGGVDPVAPVVIHGMAGCGKTSLASQFAALHTASYTSYVIDASSRATLQASLQALGGLDESAPDQSIIAGLQGPVTARLPGNSATLLIVDGVTDAGVVHGLIPRRSLCRVVITSTAEHLNDGYACLELSGWTREETLRYIQNSLGDYGDEKDAARLADAVADHPLAVCQAVNYCKTSAIPIPEYLARLQAAPAKVLAHGRAVGHPGNMVQTVRVARAAIAERDPVAAGLLTMLAHLGSGPLPLALLAADSVAAYVAALPAGRRRRSLRKTEAEDERFFQSHPWQARQALCDDVNRDRAVALLRAFSLVSISNGQIRCHPLVQELIRADTPDPEPWLRVCFGLFVDKLCGPKTAWYKLDEHLGHLEAMLAIATRHGLQGPAITYATCVLVTRLCEYGDEPGAIALGYGLYNRLLRRSGYWTAGNEVVEICSALVRPLLLSGRAQEAIDLARQNLTLAQQLHDKGFRQGSLRSAIELGEAVCNINRHEEARPVLDLLPDPRSIQAGNTSLTFALANVRAKLLALCNRLPEAKEMIDWAVAAAEPLPRDAGAINIRIVLGNTAADVYRDLGDAESSAAFISDSLARQDALGGKRVGRERGYLQTVLTAADAAVETGQLDRARQLLDVAEDHLAESFGPGTVIHAEFLAIRGRLLMLSPGQYRDRQGDAPTARSDLEVAIAILRADSNAIRTQLPAALVHVAQVYAADNEWDRAFEAANEALSIDMEQFGPDHPETAIDRQLISELRAVAAFLGR